MPTRHPAPAPMPPPLQGVRPPPETGSNLGAPLPRFGHTAWTADELTAGAVLGLAVGAFFLAVFLLQSGESRARGAAWRWAQANGYEVIKAAVVKRPRGPFRTRPAWQTVSAVTIRTSQGFNRSAWICWENVFFLYLRPPTVQWDEEAGKRTS